MSEIITILAAKQPDAPLNLSNVPGLTTAYQIGLIWIDGVYDGASPVIDYQVSYAEVSSESYIIWSSGLLVRTDIVTGLTPGTTYKFTVKSRNIINFSVYSSVVNIVSAQIPDLPTSLVNVPENTNANNIGLSWITPSFDGGNTIIDYQLYYDNANNGASFTVFESSIA